MERRSIWNIPKVHFSQAGGRVTVVSGQRRTTSIVPGTTERPVNASADTPQNSSGIVEEPNE
jgi:hypothetical protein